MKFHPFVFFVFFEVVFGYEAIINELVKRRVTVVESNYVLVEHNITFRNVADFNISSYVFKVEPNVTHSRCHAWSADGQPLKHHRVKYHHNNITRNYVQVNLSRVVPSQAKMSINIQVIYIQHAKPIEQHFTHGESVWFFYKGSYVFFSMYPTLEETLRVNFDGVKEVHYEAQAMVHEKKKSFIFGPFKYTDNYSFKPLVMTFLPLNPPIVVDFWERIIDISSLWGRIHVTEKEVLFNQGGKLKGSYNPLFGHQNPMEYLKFKKHVILLHASANNIKVYDELGKIYTFEVIRNPNFITCEILLRYPLFNGWKTTIFIEYQLPSYEYLFHSKNNSFLLKMPLIFASDVAVIQNINVRVILPSGVEKLKVKYPNGTFKRVANEWITRSLGLPPLRVIKFVGRRVLDIYADDEFEISYDLEACPWVVGGYISSGLAFVFLIVVLWNHTDFSIEPQIT